MTDPHAELAGLCRALLQSNPAIHRHQRLVYCHQAAALHWRLAQGEHGPRARRHRLERALALIGEAIALTDPLRTPRASCKFMLLMVRYLEALDRRSEARALFETLKTFATDQHVELDLHAPPPLPERTPRR